MFPILILAMLAGSAYAQKPDTCAMSENTLHTVVGSLLLEVSHDSGPALKLRHNVGQQKYIQMNKEVVADKKREAALQGAHGNMFLSEPKLFTAYRYSQQANPCQDMPHLKGRISAVRQIIQQQCARSSNSGATIIKIDGRRINWDSQGFIRDLYLGTKCVPEINSEELYYMHQLSHGFNASEEKLCQAAWAGLKEVWNKTETCSFRNDWYDIKEWSKGNLVKKRPPSK